MRKLLPILIVIIFLLIGFFLINQPAKDLTPKNIEYVKVAGKNIKVELATTPEAQAQGLSGRRELKEDEGMLFVFDHLGQHPFWMKDMNFAIDIIWIDEYEKVIYIKKDARPASPELQRGEPELYLEIYKPDSDAKYVLEVISGFSEKNNLKEGDRVEFTY